MVEIILLVLLFTFLFGSILYTLNMSIHLLVCDYTSICYSGEPFWKFLLWWMHWR